MLPVAVTETGSAKTVTEEAAAVVAETEIEIAMHATGNGIETVGREEIIVGMTVADLPDAIANYSTTDEEGEIDGIGAIDVEAGTEMKISSRRTVAVVRLHHPRNENRLLT